MIDPELSLFDGRAGEDKVIVWLEPAGSGALLRTEEWGDGIERNFGFDSIETAVRIGGPALATLAAALVMDRPELDGTAPPIAVVAAAYRGDSAASATIRRRLDELGLDYEFTMR
jgi:hypothetical protein